MLWNVFLGKGKVVFIKHFVLNINKTFSTTKNMPC
jgi:hypothetical protein